MTVQNGKIEKYDTPATGWFERFQYDVIVKTVGNYTETLINQCYYETGTISDGQETIMQTYSGFIDYKIYPNMTVANALSLHGIYNGSWVEPLETV